MEKMFKRSFLGAAVALAAVSGSANADIELAGDAVQLYGKAAGFLELATTDSANNDSIAAVIESRIGFKGRVQFEHFSPDFIWQIESGNANGTSGSFGVRDTFLGFDFNGIGSFKYGRQLVASYNYVDWPHTNPGLGKVFDWNNDIGAQYEDRADNVIRYDSATWGGFNVQASLSGMGTNTDAMVLSLGASYSRELFNIHAGYYYQGAYDITIAGTDATLVYDPNAAGCTNGNEAACWVTQLPVGPGQGTAGDVTYGIVGGSLFLGNTTLTAGYKFMDSGVSGASQNAFSVTGQYVLHNTYLFKLGYAATFDSDGHNVGASKRKDGDRALTGRIGYLLPSAILYADVRNYDMKTESNTGVQTSENSTNFLLGAEYYF